MEELEQSEYDSCELSVIIPVYNGEDYLRDTLDSVLKQTYKNFELILVDDGSIDGTYDICEEYARKDSRIRVCHQANAGMSKARDIGCQMALSETSLLFLDADDIFAPNMFADMMVYRQKDLVYTCFANVVSNKIPYYEFNVNTNVEYMFGRDILGRMLGEGENSGDICRLWGMLIKRDFYRRVEPIVKEAQDVLPQNYLNDVYCMPRFACAANDVVLLNDVYIVHRIAPNTDSRLLKPNALHYELALANKMNLDYYEKIGYRYAYEKQLMGFYLVLLKLWYQIVTQEDDRQKKDIYIKQIEEYYREYYQDLRKLECCSLGEKVTRWTIMLFGKSKHVWKILVGNIRYGIMYKYR